MLELLPPVILPIVRWLPSYDRRWLRGDVAAAIAVTALIVPKNLGYAGIAGVPLQNGLYAAAAGAIIYALFGTSRHISRARVRPWPPSPAVPSWVPGLAGDQAAELVAAIAIATGLLFLALALLRMQGGSRGFSPEGRDHGVPGGRCRRRGDRRALQVDRNVDRGLQRVERVGFLDRLARRHPRDDRRRRRRGAGRDPGASLQGTRSSGRLVLVVAGILGSYLLELGGHGSRSSETCRADCRCRSCPTRKWSGIRS